MAYQRRTLVWWGPSLRVAILRTRRERRIGMRDPGLSACVVAARVVHTFGIGDAIGLAWVSDGGIVVRSRTVPPNRIVAGPPGTMAIECRTPAEVPPIGAKLGVLP